MLRRSGQNRSGRWKRSYTYTSTHLYLLCMFCRQASIASDDVCAGTTGRTRGRARRASDHGASRPPVTAGGRRDRMEKLIRRRGRNVQAASFSRSIPTLGSCPVARGTDAPPGATGRACHPLCVPCLSVCLSVLSNKLQVWCRRLPIIRTGRRLTR